LEASRAISDYLNRLKKQLPGENSIQKLSDDELLRSELFSSKQMRRHGKIIAGAHKLSTGRASSRLLQRLADNENALLEARYILTSAVTENRPDHTGRRMVSG